MRFVKNMPAHWVLHMHPFGQDSAVFSGTYAHFVGVGAGVVVAERLKRCFQNACSGSVVHFMRAEDDLRDVQSVGLFSFAKIVYVKSDVKRIVEPRMVIARSVGMKTFVCRNAVHSLQTWK